MLRQPPDILITTPESLYLMLTSRARETLTEVECVIVDEIHAVAGSKRGSHLSLTLERLEELVTSSRGDPIGRLRTIGRSPAHRPVGDPAPDRGHRALPGRHGAAGGPPAAGDRRRAAGGKSLDLEVIVPVADLRDPESEPGAAADGLRRPARRLRQPPLDLAQHLPARAGAGGQHSSTIVFVNNRRLAERLACG